MNKEGFLIIASIIAFLVGLFAIVFPIILLEIKGVTAAGETIVWVRETGLLLCGVGYISFSVRKNTRY